MMGYKDYIKAKRKFEVWYEGLEPSREDYKREKRYQRRVNKHSARKYIEDIQDRRTKAKLKVTFADKDLKDIRREMKELFK